MGALSYADDITIISPSIRGLNKMLSICAEFANIYCITFNCAKSIPNRTHTWMLGPLLEKYHLRYQYESRTLRFMKGIFSTD